MIKRMMLVSLLAIGMTMDCKGGKHETEQVPSVERGKKMVTSGSCNDCHTPKAMSEKGPVPVPGKFLAGYLSDRKLGDYKKFKGSEWILFNMDLTAVVGPWGVSFARNLTPDQATGIGSWTEEMFIQTIRNQKHAGNGRPILPPMQPIMQESLHALSDDDLKDIFAYLKSLPPVSNKVPEPILF